MDITDELHTVIDEYTLKDERGTRDLVDSVVKRMIQTYDEQVEKNGYLVLKVKRLENQVMKLKMGL